MTTRLATQPVRLDAGRDGALELIVGEYRHDPETTERIRRAFLLHALGEAVMPDWREEHAAAMHDGRPVCARELTEGDYVQIPAVMGDDNEHAGEWWTVRRVRSMGHRTLLGFDEGEHHFSVVVDADSTIKAGPQ